MRILVADDAPFIQEILKVLISESGSQLVGVAQSGREAVQMCQSLQPDLVLMDLIMPDMSGIEATKKYSSSHPRCEWLQ